MELIYGIKNRRSIRKFSKKPVELSLIEEIVDTAKYAPSWKNSQTARYTAVVDEKLKNEIAEKATCGFVKNSNNIKSAPVLIVLSMVEGIAGFNNDGSFTTDKGTHWQSFDSGIAAEAFCLAAYEKGLGTLIMGIFDGNCVAELIDLPESESVSALIALGYADEAPNAPKRKSLNEIMRTI